MDISHVITRVNELLVQEFELDPDQIVPEARLQEDLELDSLDALDLIVLLEKEFGVKISDKDLLDLNTVGEVHGYIRQLFTAEPRQAI